MSVRLESGSRTGWLFNYHPTTEVTSDEEATVAGEGVGRAAMVLLFQDHAGDTFYVHLHYDPYIFVMSVEGREREVELGLMSEFGPRSIKQIVPTEKEDLDLTNHLSGRKRTYLKVVFSNVKDLTTVRSSLEKLVKRNQSMAGSDNTSLGQFNGSLVDAMAKSFEENPMYGGVSNDVSNTGRWTNFVSDIREYDVKYHMRVAIDAKVYCGLWYDITVTDGEATVTRCDDSKYAPAMPRIVAFDIETTKAPLRFPQPEADQVYMISYMLDGRGYLIINRDIVTEDINPFEYTPKPEYEGFFDTFNEADEAATLRRFFDEMKKYKPNVYVTYNGDYFDFPFIHARASFHGMNMRTEIGFSQSSDGAFLNPEIPHLDCFYWVNRDSYLPQGSRGLKAVTKYKLGYDPIEVDPERMLPLAQEEPQKMASYSVSDAVSTWYLYQKYVHPFIYSLATIIPMPPDDVLRKGSGGLCESLLMVQAQANNVVFPNKKTVDRERFYNGHLIDMETYIGGRVEALRSGVFRSDLPMSFNMNPETYQSLIDDLDNAIKFTLETENGVNVDEVTNLAEVKQQMQEKLEHLRDHPQQQEKPVIYHLDVGAMYPNIILTNRLQPYAIPKPDACAGCCFDSPNNENHCKREMPWKWRGELFTATREEFQRVKAQLENESFADGAIEQANLAAVQKKAYGQRKGNVLEGTAYERKADSWKRGGAGADRGNGYRRESRQQQREAAEALVSRREHDDSDGDGNDSEDDENGPKAYNKLNDTTQFNILKRRLTEYCRKTYSKIRDTREIMRSNVVCQRENSFYVDTVRLFRDRRYEYKAALKTWKKRLDAAKDGDERKTCQSRCVQMESLQLAHKCILNSFYGYVMRKGSRWSSIEMAGIVTYCGATLIQMARALVQQIGVTLELDTDGIWCCLPCTFPESFTFTTGNPKKPKVTISYPCVMLNKMVADRYTNHQYQNLVSTGVYKTHSECSIYFEVDGPYLAMLLPASREEGKSIKKRYAVFHPDGRLAELKGFELKRRGELMLIKDFQSQVFRRFLDGSTLSEAYESASVVANVALDLLTSKGAGYEMDEVLEKITESSNMSRKLSEYPKTQKSLAITTATRIAAFLGEQMVKDKGLACHFIISRLPAGRPVTERAIPTTIFRADPVLRTHFLRQWTGDMTLTRDVDLSVLVDWEYYTARFNACVQKIISIPAALQSLPNPVPRVHHPDWLEKRIRQQNSRYRQLSLQSMFDKKAKEPVPGQAEEADRQQTAETVDAEYDRSVAPAWATEVQDMEDLFDKSGRKKTERARARARGSRGQRGDAVEVNSSDSDWDDDDGPDNNNVFASDEEEEEAAKLRREREEDEEVRAQQMAKTYFSPKSTTKMDSGFFAHPGTGVWLAKQKQKWLHRAQLRKELASAAADDAAGEGDSLPGTGASGAGGTGQLTSNPHFIDLKSRALSSPWSVLEVREIPQEPGTVHVIAAIEGTVYALRVLVPRKVIVDVAADCVGVVAPQLPQGSVELSNRILPRHAEAGKLFQVDVPPGVDGDRCLSGLEILEGVKKVYEGHISRVSRFIEAVGCCASVNAKLHLQNSRRRPSSQREHFAIEELDSIGCSNYLHNATAKCAFVFHVSAETRGMLAVVNHQTKTAHVVFVQPAAAAKPAINWDAQRAEAVKSLNMDGGHGADAMKVVVEVAADAAAGWRYIHQALSDSIDSGRSPLLVVLESPTPTNELLQQRCLPASLPYLRVLGSQEDEKLLSDPFRWSRFLALRLFQRFYASFLWVEERLATSRVSGIPVCNVAQDSSSHALDVLYSRALHRRSHVLWNSADPATDFDTIDEQPREVVMPGGYTNWCVQFTLSRLDVVAILFSQVIQEGDDPNAHVLCDRGVSTHFNILRDLIADLLSQAIKDPLADALLSNVARWVRDPVSTCYEPRMVELLGGLVHRALTSVLLRLAKLGGRTVKVDSTAVVVLTSKNTLQDAANFAWFVTNSLRDQPMLILLSLKPVRYWCPCVVLDKRNYAGLYIAAGDATRHLSDPGRATPDLVFEYAFNFCRRLPEKLRKLLANRVNGVLRRVASVRHEASVEVAQDSTITLATKLEEVEKRLRGKLERYIEDDLQRELISEIGALAESRDLYTSAERAASDASRGGSVTALWPSSALALEYAKCIGSVLERIPCDSAVAKTRNNCLQLFNVSAFSPQAAPTVDPLSEARLMALVCSFCNASVHIDLLARQVAAGAAKTGAVFHCPECQSPVSAEAVEAHLVRQVNKLVAESVQQDFVCSKCREMTSTLMCGDCCGPLVGKARPIKNQLSALQAIASYQGFSWLEEVVAAAAASA